MEILSMKTLTIVMLMVNFLLAEHFLVKVGDKDGMIFDNYIQG